LPGESIRLAERSEQSRAVSLRVTAGASSVVWSDDSHPRARTERTSSMYSERANMVGCRRGNVSGRPYTKKDDAVSGRVARDSCARSSVDSGKNEL
jgi:hypothetical protein